MVVLDTNILIDHLRQRGKESVLTSVFKRFGVENLSISVATIQELFAGSSSRVQEDQVLALVASLKILPYTHEVAKLAGEIERDNVRGIDFVDAAITATCLVNKCQLATLNKKDFVGISGLELVDL